MAHRDDIVGRDIAEQKRLGFAPSLAFGLGTPTQLNLSYLIQGEDNIPDYGIPYVDGRPARFDHRFNDRVSFRNTLRFSHNDREHETTAPRVNPDPRSLPGTGRRAT